MEASHITLPGHTKFSEKSFEKKLRKKVLLLYNSKKDRIFSNVLFAYFNYRTLKTNDTVNKLNPAGIYWFKNSNGNTRTMCEIGSKVNKDVRTTSVSLIAQVFHILFLTLRKQSRITL